MSRRNRIPRTRNIEKARVLARMAQDAAYRTYAENILVALVRDAREVTA